MRLMRQKKINFLLFMRVKKLLVCSSHKSAIQFLFSYFSDILINAKAKKVEQNFLEYENNLCMYICVWYDAEIFNYVDFSIHLHYYKEELSTEKFYFRHYSNIFFWGYLFCMLSWSGCLIGSGMGAGSR